MSHKSHEIPFLHEALGHHKRKRTWWSRYGKNIAIVLAVLVGLFFIAYLRYHTPAQALYHDASAGKRNFEQAKTALEDRRFSDAQQEFHDAVGHFTEAQKNVGKLGGLKLIPGVGRQITAVDNLLHVGIEGGDAAQTLSAVAGRVLAPIASKDVNFASIPASQKGDILKLLSQSEPDLQGAKADIDLAATYLERIPNKGLLGPLASAIKPLRESFPALQSGLEQSLPLAQVAPAMLGYPTSRSYLFLLQNNTELRPTGGFIGTYGITTFVSGEIKQFVTHNVYELDSPAESFISERPPDPLQKYLKASKWFFRDSNWSPDFPTSAKTALRMYDTEKRAPQNLDGVIAVTPEFIGSLLELTGPIKVDSITFTKDNLVDTLQYQVEVAYAQQGVSDANRKEIIGKLSQSLFTKMLTLPQNKWGDLWDILKRNVAQKQFLVYLRNEQEQAFVKNLGWGGEVRSAEDDYLMVVDANLASLKSDPGVKRSIEYSVQNNGSLEATLKVHYDNQGAFNWKSTRYRTYTRIYVPQGSVLTSATGFMTDDKLHNGKPANPTTADELGKTVFSGFISIEPKTNGTLELHYALPEKVKTAQEKGTYDLLVQKQPGTDTHGLRLDIEASGRIQSHSPQTDANVAGKHVIYQTVLDQDRTFTVGFRP